ncbi:MAG: tol-pal system protein YbgF [Elusimicrobiales bacterium]
MPRLRFAALCAACALCCGCLATQEHVDDLRRQLNSLNSGLSVMQKNQADLNARMDTLSGDLSAHSENLKDFDRQLSLVSSKLDDISAMFASRMSDLGRTLKTREEENVKLVSEANRKADAIAAAMLPSKVYGDAYSLLIKKNYDGAAQGFSVYIDKFPSGELAESAYYYLGDAYWSLEKWKESAVAYATVLEKYPASQFTPSARLRYAQCLLKMGTKKEAEEYLNSVKRDFPGSPQARLAQDSLNELKPKRKPAAAPHKPARK